MIHTSLRKSAEFRRVMSRGSKVRRGGVMVVRSPGPDDATRVGLVVGRSVGKAVTRNRVKRRLRHALNDIELEQGMDYVIVADRRVEAVPFDVLTSWITDAAGERR